MIIDTYVYVWERASDPRWATASVPGWVPPAFRTGRRSVTLDEVDAEMSAAGVGGLVLVQAVNSLHHTDDLLAAAARSTRPTRVVGWLPLAEPADTYSALRRYKRETALAGVRHRLVAGEHPGLLRTSSFAESLEMVSDARLVLDILPWPPAVLAHVAPLAEQHPDLRIVIDLLGWPEIGAHRMQPWTDRLAAAADHPGVAVKVGGLYRMGGSTAWEPYVATAVELFGTERIMIGSDWPAIRMFGRGYAETIAATLAAFSDATPRERERVRWGTAAEVYGLGDGRQQQVPHAR